LEFAQSLVLFVCFVFLLFSIGLIILMLMIQTNSLEDLKEFDLYEKELDELTKEKS
jgi:hypothetical protein